jgi:hypothetical protein
MEDRKTAGKAIFYLLDVLLIIGALVGVLTIDGGRWITSNPAFYPPSEEDGPLIPVSGSAATPQPGTACLVPGQLSSSDWYDIYLLNENYSSAVNDKGAQPEFCGK